MVIPPKINSNGNGSSLQLTWTNVVTTAVALLAITSAFIAGGYTIIENQFNFVDQLARTQAQELVKQIELERSEIALIHSEYLTLREHNAYLREQDAVNQAFRSRISIQEAEISNLLGHLAHEPVEAKVVDGLSASVDKRLELIQQQINDINRQIAASVLQGFATPHPTLK